jgi:hypothetical protein
MPERVLSPTGGNAALQRRLRKHFPELHQAVLNGDITPNAAAVAAGFRRRRGQRLDPSNDDWDEAVSCGLKLWLGPLDGSEVERQLWLKHRTQLMDWFAHDGRRPQAWWRFEGPFQYPGYDRERGTLHQAGLLGEEEARRLEVRFSTGGQSPKLPLLAPIFVDLRCHCCASAIWNK